ncbi:MAG: hypothetical protein ABI995_03175 [Acidobacteriota bacterium]
MKPLLLALALGLVIQAPLRAQDPVEIIKQSVAHDEENFAHLKDYTYQEIQEVRTLDKNGKDTIRNAQTNEILVLSGRPYSRRIAKDGKPLSEKDARKEQEKMDKESEKRLKETSKDRAKFEKERREEREFENELPAAYNFKLVGQETINGRSAWRMFAEPKPGYKPRVKDAEILKKVRATVWVDTATYQFMKAEMEVVDTISWGLFVFRIPPGAKISFEQIRVNDEVWLPREVHVRGEAKLAIFKTFRLAVDVSYKDYRKFQSDSQVVDAEEVGVQ